MPEPAEPVYPPVPERLTTTGGGEPGAEPSYPPSPATGGGDRPIRPPGPGFNRKEFITNYANMVARTWIDEAFLELLRADPVTTCNNSGLPTVPGAVVRIIEVKITGTGQVKDQVDAWIEGNRTGLYDLWLPIRPDEWDEEAGGMIEVSTGDYCCCCCPCCCCT